LEEKLKPTQPKKWNYRLTEEGTKRVYDKKRKKKLISNKNNNNNNNNNNNERILELEVGRILVTRLSVAEREWVKPYTAELEGGNVNYTSGMKEQEERDYFNNYRKT